MLSHRAVWTNCVRGRASGGRWPWSSVKKSPQLCHRNTNLDIRWVSSGVDRRQLSSTQEEPPVEKPLPSQAQVVIAGGGAIGCSVAYHLAKFGWTDVVLLEQGRLSCGTTWHAAGCCAMLVEGIVRTMFEYSKQLYPKLEAETGIDTGWQQTGSIYVARTEDRMIAYRRHADAIRAMGVECELVSPRDISVYHPLLRVDDLKGALWVPGDGVATPADVTQALAKGAAMKGVQIHEKVGVEKVLTVSGRVNAVRTNKGDIRCDHFVNCTGQWAWELGQQSSPSVRVPLHSCEHFYIITDPVAGANTATTPVAQDPDGYNYMREWNGGFICGGFEPTPKPVFTDGIPSPFEFQLLEEDWDHFQPVLEQILLRMPALKEVKVQKFLNGPESFTPDLFPNMGQAPELPGYFVAAGMNSGGIASAGGVGKVMAEWIISGDPPAGTWPVDIRRFGEMHNNRRYLRERVKEILPMPYAQPYPKPEFQSARKMRMSPLYTTLEKAGAVFGVKMGYERANWFSKPESDDFMDVPSGWRAGEGTYGKPPWFNAVQEEYMACRQNVAIMDMSSFTKFEVRSSGDEVVTYLQRLCCNEVDVPVGTVLHTGMLNHYGGYENDCSLARLAENLYLIISPSNQMVRSWEWLHRHLPKEGTVQIRDITPYYAAINVLGPRSRELMAELTDAVTMSSQYFPSFTCRELSIGFAPRIRAMSLSHSGELGWMLYVPQEYALHVYDHIMHKGRDFGIRNVGYYTIAHLRMERAFAFWGIDLDASVTPFECQREHRVKFGKESEQDGVDFIGRSALLKQKQEGVRQKFVMFLLDNHDLDNDLWPWGGEPIWEGGRVVGRTTSAGYGYTLKKQVCLGFVHNPDPQTGEHQIITNNFITKSKFEIQIAGKKFSAAARLFPPQI
ncbi:pyruvate dehydrogenase phosphatase regulatory subunit, mitochondrial-like isoform X1 [Branchiostoma floridae]|uniref:Pyruvate dehydrogenase phosphatase regulatory subunit, mitochondrial-like isoform X1 n=1 Tax=Branchiostoma floridae TaxID=7739 RepID=A0A9J7LBZ6_BRAFL|nr:pyruvate dehydrogenase phosphatase regulatory subunit, mitochondrial-like isoform X1 [Branchiostoma floridae]